MIQDKVFRGAEVFYDNKTVVKKSSVPASVLKKMNNTICYHLVREYQAAGVLCVGWIPGELNMADLSTKTKTTVNKRNNLID